MKKRTRDYVNYASWTMVFVLLAIAVGSLLSPGHFVLAALITAVFTITKWLWDNPPKQDSVPEDETVTRLWR